MTDKMKSFVEAMAQDQALAEALNAAETPEAVIALAKEKGFDLTERDLAMAEVPTGELSDDALDDVAGGAGLFGYMGQTGTTYGSGLARLLFSTTVYKTDGTRPKASTLEYRGQSEGGFTTLEMRTDGTGKSSSKSGGYVKL